MLRVSRISIVGKIEIYSTMDIGSSGDLMYKARLDAGQAGCKRLSLLHQEKNGVCLAEKYVCLMERKRWVYSENICCCCSIEILLNYKSCSVLYLLSIA